MKTINIDGEEYVLKSDLPAAYEESEHVCVICTNGWIFEGRGHRDDGGDWLLSEATIVRRWDNGLGIGGIADPEHYGDYTLERHRQPARAWPRRDLCHLHPGRVAVAARALCLVGARTGYGYGDGYGNGNGYGDGNGDGYWPDEVAEPSYVTAEDNF